MPDDATLEVLMQIKGNLGELIGETRALNANFKQHIEDDKAMSAKWNEDLLAVAGPDGRIAKLEDDVKKVKFLGKVTTAVVGSCVGFIEWLRH